MNKLLEVKEFENITCNIDYKDDPEYKYIEKEIFEELEKFILTIESNNSDCEIMDFFKLTSKRNVGKVIQPKNYVGLIQMKNGFQVQILPKISFSNMEETKKTFICMIKSLRDFSSKAFSDADLKLERMNLYEVFINMYIQEVRALVKKGLRFSYLSMEDNLNYFKGKLIVGEHIKRNSVHKERFYLEYNEFSVDRPENRLLKSTLLKLQEVSNNISNIKEIRKILSFFEMVERSQNYNKDFSKVIIDRNTRDYEKLMIWSKIFLMDRSFTTLSGSNIARSLLFPMEKLFESYVTQNLKKLIDDLDWEISAQDKGFYLFDSPRQFALRPDIVITRKDGSKVVLDTKWKSLVNNPRQNYGISQTDMYQMYAYSKKYNTSEIWLIYPVNEETKDVCDIEYKSSEYGENVVVSLFFVDVANITESLEALKAKMKCGIKIEKVKL